METEVVASAREHAGGHPLPLTARLARELAPHEMLMLSASVFFSAFGIIASGRITAWPHVLLNMFVASALIVGLNLWCALSAERNPWMDRVRMLYLFPVIPIYFKTVELISFPLHGHDFDSLLITADRLLFGTNPTRWLASHFPTWPWFTEYMMICYALFYFLPLALTIELYIRAQHGNRFRGAPSYLFGGIRPDDPPKPVEQVIFVITYAFLLSYVCYIFLPSIGPRFTLHNFFDLSKDLPGLWFTEPLRSLLNRGENILPGMSMTQIIHSVTRDAFPSGHTDITILTILLAFQFRSKLRWIIAILGTSLIFSTVYLRYHYVIDVLGGLLLGAITLYTWQWLRERMLQLRARFAS